jgi:hypothetical protein
MEDYNAILILTRVRFNLPKIRSVVKNIKLSVALVQTLITMHLLGLRRGIHKGGHSFAISGQGIVQRILQVSDRSRTEECS